jgi:transcription elongation factor Elf1
MATRQRPRYVNGYETGDVCERCASETATFTVVDDDAETGELIAQCSNCGAMNRLPWPDEASD